MGTVRWEPGGLGRCASRMEGEFGGSTSEGNLSFQYRADEQGNGPLADGPLRCDSQTLSWRSSRG